MKLASHNSWTFLEPIVWWQKPLSFIGKCQKLHIVEQLDAGVEYFDLRVNYDFKKDCWYIQHGAFKYAKFEDIKKTLRLLNDWYTWHGTKIYIRVILEQNKPCIRQEYKENRFYVLCDYLQRAYPDIAFTGGCRKFDGRNTHYLFLHNNPECEIKEFYSSVTSPSGKNSKKWWSKIDDFWPWLYAKIHNKKHLDENKGSDCFLMLDFIKKEYKEYTK